MRYAIISDIHGNLEALESVLGECLKLKADKFLCAGDTVGYGASPQQCLEAVKLLRADTVAGNHDWAVSGRVDPSYFTEDGRAAVVWTRSQVSFDDIEYLNKLPLVVKHTDYALAHASLKDPGKFNYMSSVSRAYESFMLLEAPVCFVGHTHVPGIFLQRGEHTFEEVSLEVEMSPELKYIVNVGSVGQPRDANPMASFAIYDTLLRTIEIRRVWYDIKKAQKAILDAGLPRALALRLEFGK